MSAPLHAQAQASAPAPQATASTASTEPGSNLTVYLLTFGWGDVSWERFGHNAIWIKDRARGTDITYNWGMFDFAQPNVSSGDSLPATPRYWMEPIDFNSMVTYYKQRNRSVLAQELNLTPAQRLKLQQFVQWNALPENKFYRYDYYRDNCSTRLRDAIDHALSGQLQTSTVSRMTSGTYRWHTQRVMTGDIPLYTGVTLALGHPADKPLSHVGGDVPAGAHGERPAHSQHRRQHRHADSAVRSEMAIFTAGRPPEPAAPPFYLPLFVAVGIVFAAVLVLLVRSAEGGSRIAMFAATALATLWSLVAGLPGSRSCSPGFSPSTTSWAGTRT